MTAPNLGTAATIYGKTVVYNCSSTLSAVLSNASSSGKVLKINSIRAANLDSSVAFSLDLTIFRSAAHTYLASGISIPAGSTLITVSKDEYIYLEEGDAIYAKGSTSGKIDLTISYEDISL